MMAKKIIRPCYKFKTMQRRRFTQLVGSGIASLSVVSTVSARKTGELPNDRVERTKVNPWPSKDDPEHIDPGNWITHYIGWVDDSREAVQEFLDTVEYTALIDGEEINNPDQYWGPIVQETNDGETNWYSWWEYSTPPKTPGLHSFATEFHYTSELGEPGDQGYKEEGQTDYLKGYYEISP